VAYGLVQRRLLAAPKFGNDDPYVDSIGREILEYAWRELYSHQPPRGGRYLASCILFATYGASGQHVGATPDGRPARQPLVDSVGAVAGRDTHGPTALLNSVASLPLRLAVGTPVLNIRLHKSLLQGKRNLAKVAAMVRAFFGKGGLQIQVSVISKEDMLAAMKEPEKHGDLIVRIGGYSEYFTRLSRELQKTVVARTEYGP
jgi:formate C-acetyltransferase